jgi:ATP-dependent DNA helicase RecG
VEELRQAAQTAQRGLHLSRNPLIVRVLIDAGYMREQGEGIPRMFQVMEEADLAPPELAQQDFRFVVTLRKTPVYDSETRQWLRQFDALNCSREQRRVLAFARSRNMRFTSREIQKRFDLDVYAASQLIRSLVRKNIVRLVEKGGRIYEVVNQTLPQSIPDDLRLLLPSFQKTTKLMNKDLQILWDTPQRTARRRAKTLVDAGWLELSGAGRYAGYVLTTKGQSQQQYMNI